MGGRLANGIQPTPVTTPSPEPFARFPQEAQDCTPSLYWLVKAGRLMNGQSRSLAAVHKELAKTAECPCYTTLRLLPHKLERLLRLAFKRPVSLYQTRWPNGGAIIGLTEDGKTAVAMAVTYLNEQGVSVG